MKININQLATTLILTAFIITGCKRGVEKKVIVFEKQENYKEIIDNSTEPVAKPEPGTADNLASADENPVSQRSNGNYMARIVSDKAYFYEVTGNGLEKKKSYLIKGDQVECTNESTQPGYTSIVYTNKKGKQITGWISNDDLSAD